MHVCTCVRACVYLCVCVCLCVCLAGNMSRHLESVTDPWHRKIVANHFKDVSVEGDVRVGGFACMYVHACVCVCVCLCVCLAGNMSRHLESVTDPWHRKIVANHFKDVSVEGDGGVGGRRCMCGGLCMHVCTCVCVCVRARVHVCVLSWKHE